MLTRKIQTKKECGALIHIINVGVIYFRRNRSFKIFLMLQLQRNWVQEFTLQNEIAKVKR